MVYIKIIKETFLSGEHAQVDEVFEVDEQTAELVIGAKRAVQVERPEEPIVEPPKRKVVKVGKKKGEEAPEAPKE